MLVRESPGRYTLLPNPTCSLWTYAYGGIAPATAGALHDQTMKATE